MPPYYGHSLHKARKKIGLHPGLLWDTLDWMNPWHQTEDSGLDEEFHHAPLAHLYPRL
jgi:hypothetical protein